MTGIPGDLLKVKENSNFWQWDDNECFAYAESNQTIKITCSTRESKNDFALLKCKLADKDNKVLLVNGSGTYPVTTIDRYQMVQEALYGMEQHLYSRMKQIAEDQTGPVTDTNLFENVRLPHNTRAWHTAFLSSERPQWYLPLIKENLTKFLPEDQPHRTFPQNPFASGWWGNKISCYRSNSFPQEFSGEIHLFHKKPPRGVKFILHGFLQPSMTHYHLWKHVIGIPGYSPRSTQHPHEPSEWKADIPDAPAPDSLKECGCESQTGRQQNSCDFWNCTSKRFRQAHTMLNPALEQYFEKAVTFFQHAPTKEVRLDGNESLPDKITKFLFAVAGDKKENPKDKAYWFYKFLALEGICFDWHQQNSPPRIHLRIITFYHKHETQPLWSTTKNYKGTKLGNFHVDK